MTPITTAQAITADRVRDIFKGLENGDGGAFFTHVADDVDWIVMGTHPLAGHYLSKADFIEGLSYAVAALATAHALDQERILHVFRGREDWNKIEGLKDEADLATTQRRHPSWAQF